MHFDFESMVRDRAYAIWEDEGRPDGREQAHWIQACREIGEAMRPAAAPASAKKLVAAAKPARKASATRRAPARRSA